MLKRFILIMGLAGMVIAGSPSAYAAYVIDGLLDDWGVTPFNNWTPSSPTADFNEENNRTHPYYRGATRYTANYQERRDLEALYFDNDDTYVYWAMVSSIAFNTRYISPIPEDMALDLDGDGAYEFALDVGLIDFQLDTGSGGTPVERDVYSVREWRSAWGSEFAVTDYDVIGTYEIVNLYLGDIEVGVWPFTFALEGRVERSLFGDAGDSEIWRMLFAKFECIADYIELDGTLDGGPVDPNNPDPAIPEPSTILLFGSGLLGLLFLRNRKS